MVVEPDGKLDHLMKVNSFTQVKYVRIKVFKLICGIVAKLLRANGGCLGVKCRRKTWKAAISFGEELNIL